MQVVAGSVGHVGLHLAQRARRHRRDALGDHSSALLQGIDRRAIVHVGCRRRRRCTAPRPARQRRSSRRQTRAARAPHPRPPRPFVLDDRGLDAGSIRARCGGDPPHRRRVRNLAGEQQSHPGKPTDHRELKGSEMWGETTRNPSAPGSLAARGAISSVTPDFPFRVIGPSQIGTPWAPPDP